MDDLLNNVKQGDCLEIMRMIPDASVDLVVTDPPYGIEFSSNWSKNPEYRGRVKTVDGIANDGKDNTPFLSRVIDELQRVMKDNTHIYWFTRWDQIPIQLPLLQRYFNIKNAIIWDKGNWSMGDLKGAYAGQYEVILFAQKGRRTLNEVDGTKRHPDILRFNRVPASRLRHSHEKPENLIELLIRKSSVVGEIVLDPFCGSGTTAAVAKQLRREYITMDLDESAVDIASKRIGNAGENLSMEATS